ncbi:Fanconi anemia core complex-associated protein 20 isoform X2 [Rhinatrema bivittatum]|uniref:Fanconi anemia core complex-associated protein 20 isoform X2 n=1 Tax=Rhinatrema bivittatum TaxID=194408 RepID=UPI00112EE695|nr:Fanconi anemia core complex-associated protein 20 isoform X2 [Rhinatrema bivittatum]
MNCERMTWAGSCCLLHGSKYMQRVTKHAGNEKKLRKPETFTVGLKHFEWTAFPSFLETDSVRSKNPYVCGSLDRERITLEEEWNLQREESLTCIAAPSEVEKRLGTSTVEVYAKARKQENPSKQLKLQCLEKPVQKQQRPRTTGGISSSRLTSSENVKQSLGVGCNSKWNPEQDKAEKIPRGETLQTPKQEQKMVTEEAAGTTAKGGGSERVTEVTASLQSCPMCLVQFTERLTQLDMDSHLAKCLSESTEDILW